MKRTLALCCILWFSLQLSAQDTTRVYTWEEALLVSPDSVYRLDASRQKWDSLPERLFLYTRLRFLDISKNRLVELPSQINVFTELRVLEASKNRFSAFPVTLCQMTHLRKLGLSRNQITSIPACIGYFSELVMLDLWDNPIVSLPEELTKLTNLQVIDLRGILFGPTFQDGWRAKMPNVTWHFDAPCNCIEK